MHHPRILAVFLMTLLAAGAGCAQASHEPKPGPEHAAAPPAVEQIAADRALIVTMNVSVVVADVNAAVTKLREDVVRAGGYVSDANTSGPADERTARLELRLPADKTASMRDTLDHLGEVKNATEKVEDVTEQRADLKARLHNARVQEKRLLELLSSKTAGLHDVIEAEKEIARVRDIIERFEAQERTLDGKIHLATIHVTLTAKEVEAWRTPGKSLAHAGGVGIRGAAAVAVYAGMLLLTVGPTLLPPVLLTLLIVTLLRRRANVAPRAHE